MKQVNENRKQLFLRACRFEPVERVPVWIMRQAGRYLPEYQAVRARHSFLEICKTPEIAAEVSLQPFRTIGVDAVIVFSDILIVAEAMGMPLDVPDSGPVLSNPVRDRAAIERLRDFDPLRDTKFVGDAIRSDLPRGRSRRSGDRLRRRSVDARLLHDRRANARRHLAREAIHARRTCASARLAGSHRARHSCLSEIANRRGCVRRAAFRHLGGRIDSRTNTKRSSYLRHSSVFESLGAAGVPKILYGKGSSHLIDLQAQSGTDVLSVDWRTDLAEARRTLGDRVALQGNVDPNLLLGPEPAIRAAAREAVEKTGGLGHILNLGHGILPTTPVENARAFVEAGQAAPLRARAHSGKAD